MEDPLPYDVGAFDVVTAFNTIQFVSDPIATIKNMSQVTKPGGLISIVVWGPPQQCESAIMFQEMGPLMPPPPADAPRGIAWSDDGQLENAAANAGLTVTCRGGRRQSADLLRPCHCRPHPTQFRARTGCHPTLRAPGGPRRTHTSLRQQPQARRHLPAGERLPLPGRTDLRAATATRARVGARVGGNDPDSTFGLCFEAHVAAALGPFVALLGHPARQAGADTNTPTNPGLRGPDASDPGLDPAPGDVVRWEGQPSAIDNGILAGGSELAGRGAHRCRIVVLVR